MTGCSRKKVPKCSVHCTSIEHGNLVCAAILRGLNDEAICYIRQVCASFSTVLDKDGHSGLHVAASCGKNKIVSYLLSNGAQINLQHSRTGNTALHFAVMYGNIDTTHLLLKFGADINIINMKECSPLIYLNEHFPFNKEVSFISNDQIKLYPYAWGRNDNYNLGLAKEYSGRTPEIIDFDLKENDSIVEIIPNKYHTLFKSNKGKIFACGHGARLGIEAQSSAIVPQIINSLKIKVISVASGVDHSVFLTENRQVWTCGKNSYKQLGFDPAPEYVNCPIPLKWPEKHLAIVKNIIGVGAGAYHTVFWTETAIVTFGLNGGQLGHISNDKTPFIVSPTIITIPKSLFSKFSENGEKIEHLFSGDAAIIFSTNFGNVFIINNYETKRLISADRLKSCSFSIRKLSCKGGVLDTKCKYWNDKYLSHHKPCTVSLVILDLQNNLYVWSLKNSNQGLLSVEPHWQRGFIFDFCLNANDIYYITNNLRCFNLKFIDFSQSPLKENDFNEKNSQKIFAKRSLQLPYLCRPYYIFCDPQGESIFSLQYNANSFIRYEAKVLCESTYQEDFSSLYFQNDDLDPLCDVAIKGKCRTTCAHSYIISYHNDFIYKLILKEKNKLGCKPGDKVHLNLNALEDDSINVIIEYIYTHTLQPSYILKCDKSFNDSSKNLFHPKKFKNNGFSSEQKNVMNAAKQMGFDNLRYTEDGILVMTPLNKSSRYNRHHHEDLWDVWFQCEDKEKLLGAHKCVLVARCQYFSIYFSSRWCSISSDVTDNIVKVSCSYVVFKAILDFLYTDSGSHMSNFDTETLCDVLINCNRYLLPMLQEICEVLLSNHITLKNCLDMLQFCRTYHTDQLLTAVHEFMALNIQYYMPLRSFKELNSEYIARFTEDYKNMMHSTPHVKSQKINSIERFDNLHNFFNKFEDLSETKFAFNKPTLRGTLWLDTYPEHPTFEELQEGLIEDSSLIDESADDWVESYRNCKENKNKKPSTRRKKHHSGKSKLQSTNRRRRASSSSQLSTSSNSEGEGVLADAEEQFTFDDLTDRKDNVSKQNEQTQYLGNTSIENDYNVEQKINSLKISEIKSQREILPVRTDDKGTKIVALRGTIESFPSLQESFSIEANTRTPYKERMPKMPSVKKKNKNVDSSLQDAQPQQPAWVSENEATKSHKISLADIMKDEEKMMKKDLHKDCKMVPLKKKTGHKKGKKLSLEEPTPTSPDNDLKGWNVPKNIMTDEENLGSPSFHDISEDSFISPHEYSFSSILEDEASKSKNLSTSLNKPLHLIQLEERAIEELLEFYGGAYNPDELVTVTRVKKSLANPLWKKS